MLAKIISIPLPEYTISCKPDYESIGDKVDSIIECNFPDGCYLIRAIGKDDHPNLTLDQLVEVITKTGTDKYEPDRKSVAHEDFANYDYDIQAEKFEIKDGKIILEDFSKVRSLFGEIVYNFYENAPHDRGYSVRIDLLLIYDSEQFDQARTVSPELSGVDPKFEKHLFKFKDPNNKPNTLVGIVKILRE